MKSVNYGIGSMPGPTIGVCECMMHIEQSCLGLHGVYTNNKTEVDSFNYDSEVGRMIYTISMLLLFSLIILLLMVRSIRRSRSTIEVESLLDAMRFREELDIQQRQKRRLIKAKNKVTAWLSRTNDKMWQSSPHIILPSTTTIRQNSLQSNGSSFVPEIVISNSEDGGGGMGYKRTNSYTPSLSLIYDFGDPHSRKNSNFSEFSDTLDLSHFHSDLSIESEDPLYSLTTSSFESHEKRRHVSLNI